LIDLVSLSPSLEATPPLSSDLSVPVEQDFSAQLLELMGSIEQAIPPGLPQSAQNAEMIPSEIPPPAVCVEPAQVMPQVITDPIASLQQSTLPALPAPVVAPEQLPADAVMPLLAYRVASPDSSKAVHGDVNEAVHEAEAASIPAAEPLPEPEPAPDVVILKQQPLPPRPPKPELDASVASVPPVVEKEGTPAPQPKLPAADLSVPPVSPLNEGAQPEPPAATNTIEQPKIPVYKREPLLPHTPVKTDPAPSLPDVEVLQTTPEHVETDLTQNSQDAQNAPQESRAAPQSTSTLPTPDKEPKRIAKPVNRDAQPEPLPSPPADADNDIIFKDAPVASGNARRNPPAPAAPKPLTGSVPVAQPSPQPIPQPQPTPLPLTTVVVTPVAPPDPTIPDHSEPLSLTSPQPSVLESSGDAPNVPQQQRPVHESGNVQAQPVDTFPHNAVPKVEAPVPPYLDAMPENPDVRAALNDVKRIEITTHQEIVRPADVQLLEVARQPLITTDPLANTRQLQLPPLTMIVQKVSLDSKAADHTKTDSSGREKSGVSVPAQILQPSDSSRSLDSIEQPRPMHLIEIPDLPKLKVVRTVSMEVGEADSQVSIRIEDRGSSMRLHLDTGNETLHQALDSSVGSLMQALKRVEVPLSTVEVSRKSPIEKVRRAKETSNGDR